MKPEKRGSNLGWSLVRSIFGSTTTASTSNSNTTIRSSSIRYGGGNVLGILFVIFIIGVILYNDSSFVSTTTQQQADTVVSSSTRGTKVTFEPNSVATDSSSLSSTGTDTESSKKLSTKTTDTNNHPNTQYTSLNYYYKQEQWYTDMLGKISDTCKHISHFFHHFLPHQQCSNIVRVGKCDDGSKLVCMDHFVEVDDTNESAIIANTKQTNPQPKQKKIQKYNTIRAQEKNEKCIVYSFGSSDDSCFESDIASKTICEIHIFDPTSSQLKHPRWTYHSYGLTGFNANITTYWNWRTQRQASCKNCPMRTLQEIMIELNHTAIDILKIDIDGAEWRSLEHVYTVMKTLPAIQIQLELTGLDITDENDSLAGKTIGVYKLWENLFNDNYTVFHIEPNLGTCQRIRSRSASFEYALMKRQPQQQQSR